jgi:hypothetical protein
MDLSYRDFCQFSLNGLLNLIEHYIQKAPQTKQQTNDFIMVFDRAKHQVSAGFLLVRKDSDSDTLGQEGKKS